MTALSVTLTTAIGQLRARPASFVSVATAVLLSTAALTCFSMVIAAGLTGPAPVGDQPGPILIGAAFGEIVIVISLILTVNTLAFATRQQHRDMALMRLLAASPRQIKRVLRWELIVVVLIVCVPSWLLGVVASHWFIDSLVERGLAPAGTETNSPVIPMVIATVLVIVVGMACSTLTSRSVVRGAPLTALQAAGSVHRALRGLRILLGLAALGSGVMFCRFLAGQPPDKAADGALVATLILLLATTLLGPVLARSLVVVVALPVQSVSPRSGWLAVTTLRGYSERLSTAVVPIMLLTGLSGTFQFITAVVETAVPIGGGLASVTDDSDRWLRGVEIAVVTAFASVAVVNTLVALTTDRRGEFELLRRIGATRGQIRAMLYLEAVLIAGLSIAVGTAIATGTATAFAASLPGSISVRFPSDYAVLATGALGLTVMTIGGVGERMIRT